eukprot:TRINITY_DN2248_c0_g1_i1.p1 TRINITY_DN2248_c0_g1~~TRINITY_DN2248_c0_g1_i1.p1  ORF type:complete len:296 (+),score=78.26 TRINITY_DN2248_c0_g1_i1:253-1140(+)
MRVLSIQSHVVSGYVGNKASTFPLQLHGFDVDPISTVQFSNHSGFSVFKGQRLGGDELMELVEGLEANELLDQDFVVSGYIGNEGVLTRVLETVQMVRKNNENSIYVCDPVLGDNGKLYVPEALIDLYRDQVLYEADMITPNQFEAEKLVGRTFQSESDVLEAMEELATKYSIRWVFITSTFLTEGKMVFFARIADENAPLVLRVEMDKLDWNFTGTGDLLTSLLLAHLFKKGKEDQQPIPAIIRALASIRAVLKNTYDAGKKENANLRDRELKLVQSMDVLLEANDDGIVVEEL